MKTKLYFFLWVCLSTLLIACVDDDIEPDVVPVTGVSLNKTALALDEGESESLIATVIPDNATNKKVTWKSSDTSVATVNASGKVTAQATGTVVVVVITEDGAEVATCTVTCGDGAVEPEIPVTDVALNKSTLSLIEGQSESLQVIYNPQIQISAESETKRSIFREKDKTKRSKKESAQHSKSRNKSFVMTSVSAL